MQLQQLASPVYRTCWTGTWKYSSQLAEDAAKWLFYMYSYYLEHEEILKNLNDFVSCFFLTDEVVLNKVIPIVKPSKAPSWCPTGGPHIPLIRERQ